MEASFHGLGEQALVPSISIDRLVAHRDAVVAKVTEAHARINEAVELCSSIQLDIGTTLELVTYSGRRDFSSRAGLGRIVKGIDAKVWSFLLHESGLQSFLDATAREQWRKAHDSDDVPEVTLANIEATFSALYASRGEMFERGVIELFRSLSWDYKSNSPVRFGRKLVLRGVVDALAGRWDWARPNFSGCNSLDDLIRVMSILDGKPEPDHRNGAYPRLSAAGFPQCGEVDLGGYVKVRGYKNGNGHVFFMRPDLVDRMNAILARHHPDALPPSSTDR